MSRLLPVLLLAVVASAQPGAPGEPEPAARLIFEDHFDQPALDPVWQVKVGEWKPAGGALQVRGPDAFAVIGKDAGPSLRLEYTAWSDDPCDLSACLNLDPGATHPDGLFFQFGGFHNQKTGVSYQAARQWEAAVPLIRPGTHHRVVCERWGAFARFFVDGKLLFHGVIPGVEPAGHGYAGLFIYTTGWVDDVKLYRLEGEPAGDIRATEPPLSVSSWVGFEEPSLPPGWSLREGGGTARVVSLRDYQNAQPLPRWIDDHCLELALTGAGDAPAIGCAFPEQATGLIELEAMAEPGAGLALELLDTAGRPAVRLATDEMRRFTTLGPDGLGVLDPPVAYTGISPRPPLRLPVGRWLRLRVQFDAVRGRFTVAIVSMYVPEKSYNKFPATGHWFVFGKDVPFARPAADGRVAGLRLALEDRGTLRVDNLYAIAPFNGVTVRGRDMRLPARELLGSAEHPRHDPTDLYLYSLRETLGTQGAYGEVNDLRGGRHPEVVKAALAYDTLMVDLAARESDLRGIQRAARARGRVVDEAARQLAAAEAELATLYRLYVDAYVDGLNAERMKADVQPAAGRLRDHLDQLRQALAAESAGLGLKPLPEPGQPQVGAEQGRYRTAAGPAFFFPQTNWLWWPKQDRLLRLDGATTVYSTVFYQAPEGSFIDGPKFDQYAGWFLKGTPAGRFVIADCVGLHGCYVLTPDWWLKQHETDPDAFLCDATGRIPAPGGKPWESDGRARLNFWSPDVRTALDRMAHERARYFAEHWPGRVMAWEILQEAHSGADFAQSGYNPSAKAAFRERLRKGYGDVGALNRAWGTDYVSFGAIEPPATGAGLPSPLNYEFQRFRQEGYRDWVAAYRAAVKAELPDVPLVNRIVDIVPYPTDHTWSFDWPALYPLFDYFEFHTSMGERSRLSDRLMTSLRRALGGESGVMEWGLGSSGELFDEVGARRATEAEFFRFAAGGRTLFNVWYGTGPGWADCANWTDPRWGHTTLRYSAASIPVSIARLRKYERWLLDLPQVEPRLNILESDSSFLNAAPLHGPRSRLVLAAQTFEGGGLDYGFLWEDLILSRKQPLAGSDMLVLPCATCLPEPLQDQLQRWVEAGGRLIAIAPPGLYDPWGRPSGKLLAAAFRGVTWSAPRPGEWEAKGATAAAAPDPVLGGLYRAKLGKGELLVYGKVDSNARPSPSPALLDLVRSLRPRQPFRAADNRLELSLRQDPRGNRWVLTALNGNLSGTAEDEVYLTLPVRRAVDVELGLDLPLRRDGAEKVLPLALGPGEGVVIELRRWSRP
ncbi:MAG: beta-galactosidase [Armatimonadetes bacterium]|nr:beta-galactosidase [Armatimonadota bacterium]